MNRRRMLLLSAAAGLLILNVWHWWPGSASPTPAKDRVSGGGALQVEDFVIQGVAAGKLPLARRDVFQPKRPVVVKAPAPVKPPEPPPKSPEELEREAAQAEYLQIRCLAVVFRGGQGQAMMGMGQQIFHVGVGGQVGSRFVVNKIEEDGVLIQDSKSGIGGKIGLSGASK